MKNKKKWISKQTKRTQSSRSTKCSLCSFVFFHFINLRFYAFLCGPLRFFTFFCVPVRFLAFFYVIKITKYLYVASMLANFGFLYIHLRSFPILYISNFSLRSFAFFHFKNAMQFQFASMCAQLKLARFVSSLVIVVLCVPLRPLRSFALLCVQERISYVLHPCVLN